MPPFLPPLLAALLLTALTWVASYPVQLRSFRVDALDVFLLVFALVNLRLAFRQASGVHAPGQRTPWWFWLAGLGLAALVTYRAVEALNA